MRAEMSAFLLNPFPKRAESPDLCQPRVKRSEPWGHNKKSPPENLKGSMVLGDDLLSHL